MPKYTITQDGKTFEVDVAEGQDPNVVLADFLGREQSLADATVDPTVANLPAVEDFDDLPSLDGNFTPSPRRSGFERFIDDVVDAPGVVADFARGTLRDITGADVDISAERERDATDLELAQRGTGLGLRTVTGALPKAATGLSDLTAMILNLIPAGLSEAQQAIGGSPIDARLPTDATAQLDAFLDEIFPTPETLPERIINTGGEIALTGGAASTALVPKTGAVASSPSTQGILRNLGDEIGEFFARNPVKSSVIEGTGGLGAATGAELSEEAELGPGGQITATTVGGLLGGLTPQGLVNLFNRARTGILNTTPGLAPGHRAAVELQGDVADPQAVARAALDAPEGVTPARAATDIDEGAPALQAREQRVLDDDPVLATRVEADRAAAEEGTLRQLAEQFGPGTDRRVWEQNVISRASPDDAEIPIGEVDDMVRSSASAFDDAYRQIDDFPIQTQTVQVEGGNVPLAETITGAADDAAVLTAQNVRDRVRTWLQGRYDDLVGRGTQVEGAAEGVVQVQSQDLLELRQVIRQQQRQRARTGQTSADAAAEAQLLDNADRAVTAALESQLPAEASAALRATDARYADFKVVEDAVRRSGDQGLTPQQLRAAVNRSSTPGQVARGETGDLGTLAEQGTNAAALLKPSATEAQARRLVRNMTPEQQQQVRSDLNTELMRRSSQQGQTQVNGDKYLKQIDQHEPQLRAAGFSDTDLSNMRAAGRELRMLQGRNPTAVQNLLEDNVGSVFRLLAAVAGSRAGTRILKILGGTTGAGPNLILAQFGSRQMQQTLTNLSVDKADQLIREAMVNPELFAALMTRPTATVKQQADNARIINAWITRLAPDESAETEDE